MSQSSKYPLGRAVGTFLISGLLGAVWGATAQGSLGVLAWALHLGFGGWYLLCAGVLIGSLHVVQKVTAQAPLPISEAEAHRLKIDKRISVAVFTMAYLFILLVLSTVVVFSFRFV